MVGAGRISPDLIDEGRVTAIAASIWLGALLGGRPRSSPGGHGRSWPAGLDAAAPLFPVLFVFLLAGLAASLAVFRRTLVRHPVVVVCLLGFLSASVMAFNVEKNYQPMEPGRLDATAVVRSDPEPIGGGWRLEIQLDSGPRLDASGFGSAGFAAQQLEVGQLIVVSGTVRPIGDRPWLRNRHIVGRLALESLRVEGDPRFFNRTVNRIRRVVADGAVDFDPRQEALYLGLVIGDDRFQHLSQKAQFRAAGLTHLLAVSGQNVAFVLLVTRPLLLLFGYRLRLVLIVLVLVLFVGVTRAEPSVLRATAAAIVGAWATVTGRSRSGVRALAGGVVLAIFLDPFLVRVVGFQLSVAASGGIIVFGPALARRIPFPAFVAEPLAITVAAQLAVAPLLVSSFGPLPLAAIPANLAAGWAAGVVMTAGLTMGPLAGLFATAGFDLAASVIQLPARLAVQWIDGAARWSAALPLPRLGGRDLIVVATAWLLFTIRPRQGWAAAATMALSVAMVTATVAATAPRDPDGTIEFDSGATYWPRTAKNQAVLIIPARCSSRLADELLANNIGAIDIVVSESGDRQAGQLVAAVVEIVDAGVILAPSLHRIQGATRVTETQQVPTDWGVILIASNTSRRRLIIEWEN